MKRNKSFPDRLRAAARYIVPLFAVFLFGSVSPNKYPKDYFRSPLGIPLSLAGSFAEMRSNHFHSGLDIKTNGQSGYRIYATANGWVSRISVSPGGFGNALYVTHPNGYMTVYAHLDRFSEPIASYVKDIQYTRQSFAIDAFPGKEKFPVGQGDVIAFSGNSGSSSGPHLHFEVRDASTGWPENPLLFGFDIKDTRAPRIRRVKLYAMDEDSQLRIQDTRTGGWRTVRGGDTVLLDVRRTESGYRFSRAGKIEASGQIGFGIQTHDYHDGSPNQLGAFQIDLEVNDSPIFRSQMERFSFNLTRHINAHVDYEEYVRNRRWIQRSHVLPGNRLPIYDTVERGMLSVAQDATYDLTYRISDAFGNEVTLPFQVQGMGDMSATAPPMTSSGDSTMLARYNQAFAFQRPGIRVRFATKTLFDDAEVSYTVRHSGPSNRFGPVHRIHDRGTPVQEAYVLALIGDEVPERLRHKVSLARVLDNGRLDYAGGKLEGGWVKGSVRTFGDYTIAADTLAPSIRPLNISSGKNMSRTSNIRFRIRDNFSGIKRYEGRINGEWALFSFDAKTGTLKHTFDEKLSTGDHRLQLTVEDQLGNTSSYEVGFSR